jgi:hypothetical protein
VAARITSGDVENVLAAVNSIRAEARVAFQGRIKHFQRQGFPEGSNTGKGKPAEHTLDTLLQLVFAFELSQAGLPPAMTAFILKGNWFFIREACVLAMIPIDAAASQSSPWPDGDLFILFSPIALDQLMLDPSTIDAWPDPVEVLHRSQLVARIGEGKTDVTYFSPWRMLVIDVRFLANVTLQQLRKARPDLDLRELWMQFWAETRKGGDGFDIQFNEGAWPHVDPQT